MRNTISVGGKVKKTPSSQVDPDRYSFLKLSDAEPDLGVPPANESIIVSDTSGNRTWVTLAGSLSIQGGQLVSSSPAYVEQATEPVSPNPGDEWFDSSTLIYYKFLGQQWTKITEQFGVGTEAGDALITENGDLIEYA